MVSYYSVLFFSCVTMRVAHHQQKAASDPAALSIIARPNITRRNRLAIPKCATHNSENAALVATSWNSNSAVLTKSQTLAPICRIALYCFFFSVLSFTFVVLCLYYLLLYYFPNPFEMLYQTISATAAAEVPARLRTASPLHHRQSA